jgi:hypothetical protein
MFSVARRRMVTAETGRAALPVLNGKERLGALFAPVDCTPQLHIVFPAQTEHRATQKRVHTAVGVWRQRRAKEFRWQITGMGRPLVESLARHVQSLLCTEELRELLATPRTSSWRRASPSLTDV